MTGRSVQHIVFWQGIVSPHMAFLASELSLLGHNVTYMAGAAISAERAAMGWQVPSLPGLRIEYVQNPAHAEAMLDLFPRETIHVVQGVRGKGYLQMIISELRRRRLRWCAVVETIKEDRLTALVKRLVYSYNLALPGKRPDFLLAIGAKTPGWLARRGYPPQKIYPFSYFLENSPNELLSTEVHGEKFCIGYVGRLDANKSVHLIFDAVREMPADLVEVKIVGSGPLEDQLKRDAQNNLRGIKIEWFGQLPMPQARAIMQTFDCLVLPSRHDGWGAVVTEALMAGVPVICSDGCGAAEAVRASGVGGVFPTGDAAVLRALLARTRAQGRFAYPARLGLASWARSFSASEGAAYLERIIHSVYCHEQRPAPPWIR